MRCLTSRRMLKTSLRFFSDKEFTNNSQNNAYDSVKKDQQQTFDPANPENTNQNNNQNQNRVKHHLQYKSSSLKDIYSSIIETTEQTGQGEKLQEIQDFDSSFDIKYLDKWKKFFYSQFDDYLMNFDLMIKMDSNLSNLLYFFDNNSEKNLLVSTRILEHYIIGFSFGQLVKEQQLLNISLTKYITNKLTDKTILLRIFGILSMLNFSRTKTIFDFNQDIINIFMQLYKNNKR